MYDPSFEPDALTPAGRRRREAILLAALRAAGRRRRRRFAGRAAATAAAVAVLAAGVWSVVTAGRPASGSHPLAGRPVEPVPPQPPSVATERAAPGGATPTGDASAASRPAGPASPLGPATLVAPGGPADPSRVPAAVPRPGRVVVVGRAASRPGSVPVVITRIATDPTLVDRLAVRGPPAGVERLDADGLQRALGSAGLAGGVIVRRGRPEVWWQPMAAQAKAAGDGRDF
jgi:hypothetical protein